MKLSSVLKRIGYSSSGLRLLSTIAAMFIISVRLTSRFTTINFDAAKSYIDNDKPFIAAFWHGRLLMAPTGWPRRIPLYVMVSQHGDGELIARTAAFFGVKSIRGSTSKGGANALRNMLKALKAGNFVGITPDGPRGPRMQAQMGIITLAQISGAPIFPATYAVSRRKVAKSWDKFLIALPFSKGIYLWGEPIFVPRDASDVILRDKQLALENQLNNLSKKADELVGVEPIEPIKRNQNFSQNK
tara:strand:+ start:18985 stop:19716 length:732 start_codon:yes stop_codon:yes gene_type:complete